MTFSERYGFKPKKAIQIDSIDKALRNSLWNIIKRYFSRIPYCEEIIWCEFLKNDIDDLFGWTSISINFHRLDWYEVYDLLEFLITDDSILSTLNKDEISLQGFKAYCNEILKKEVSAFRLIGDKVVPIASEYEINAIEEALNTTEPFGFVNEHLKRSLELLSDRTNPDYRNSIKEAISAVESICCTIADDNNATLGKALSIIEKQKSIPIHKALKDSLSKLYGYTSDAEGIRHALTDEPNLDLEDAKYMLVSCSAFINYLIVKADKAGINFID